MNGNKPLHYLLTSLGTSPRRITYKLDANTAEAEYAPLALLRLLEPSARPNTVLCLLTPTARDKVWDDFRRAIEDIGIDEVRSIDIPEGDDVREVATIIETAAVAIDNNARLTLDITHGPRHVPFVLYTLALYLSSLKQVTIEAAWYGKYESANEIKPLINLGALLEFPQWFYAVRLFRETGFTSDLANRFKVVENALPEGPERGPARQAGQALDDFSKSYESGLPLELGLKAGKLCHVLENKPLQSMQGLIIPQAATLSAFIEEAAKPFRFARDALRNGQSRGEWKTNVELTSEELRRQADLIDRYIERGQVPLALGLMREWVVSLGVLHRGEPGDWLKRAGRIRVEREIGAISQPCLREHLNEDQVKWGRFWDQLGKQRNQIAHCGMKPEVATPGMDSIRDFWNRIKSADQAWSSFGGGNGSLLVTPLGMSPGVLYSAIRKIQPASLLVLGSEQAQEGMERALEKVDFAGSRHSLVMQDPFNGFKEIKSLGERARKTLLGADEVLVNLTGGTTMMGIAVQRMFEQARNDQRPCRRFVLTDTRPAEEQKNNPWVESDLFWLDPDSGEEDGNE